MRFSTFQRLFAWLGLCGLARLCAAPRRYLPAKETIRAAARRGETVCEYVEQLWNQVGVSVAVIEQIAALGALERSTPTVLEIGAGTGRYLEQILALGRPASYESYEIATDWANYLSSRYGGVSHQADGVSLSATADNLIDFLHVHGVFVYLSFLNSSRYFREVFRVLRTGGYATFDICSEACFDDDAVDAWLRSGHDYPCFLSKGYVVALFQKHGLALVGSFFHPYGAARSEYLVFCRSSAVGTSRSLDVVQVI
jgi:SAM-dependent methyltransferase